MDGPHFTTVSFPATHQPYHHRHQSSGLIYVCLRKNRWTMQCLLLLPILLQSLTTYWRIPTASLVGSWWLKLELVSGLVAAGV